jgi:ketosteroid isomerase-like protein
MAMALAIASSALACPKLAGASPRTFTALEARLSAALANYDAAEVGKLFDDDLVFVFPDGKLSRKAERLAAQQPPADHGGPRLVAHNDGVAVEYEDGHMAVVMVRSSWRFGDAQPQHFLATHVWVRRAHGWRLLSAQVAQLKEEI